MKVNLLAVKNYFKRNLATNAAWAVRGMLKIYSYQTASEQSCQQTHDRNDMGFSGCDAEILSSFSQQVQRGRTLSDKQLAIVYRKMPRYWKQLYNAVETDKLPKLIENVMKGQVA
jgi:hypothetical protein